MKHTIRTLSALLLSLLLALAPCCALSEQTDEEALEVLYRAAVRDAVFADPEEILPLVMITEDDKLASWNEDRTKVLMLSWHKYPDSYPAGATIKTEWGEIWTFTADEIRSRYDEAARAGEADIDWTLRLKQLIGLPPYSAYTHVTGFWVSPSDLVRPAYETDITKGIGSVSMDVLKDEDFRSWFEENIIWSYFSSEYPWTRLGYTYDWADNEREYGLSEFLIQNGSSVDIEFTYTTEEFIAWLRGGK